MSKLILPLSAAAALALVSGCAQDSSRAAYTSTTERETETTYAYQPREAKQQHDTAAMISKMEELGKIGPRHNILTSFVGNWDCQSKIWCPMQPEPIESRGTMNVKAINDGRFVQADYKGTVSMPGPDGKLKDTPYTGTKIWGYSNADNEYQAIWTDNMNTSMTWLTGTPDSDSATVTLTGSCKGPDESGNISKRTTTEKIKMISADKYVSELWTSGPNEPKKKVMEITYTRITGPQTQP